MAYKHLILGLMLLYNQDIVCSHILTSRDLPIASCVRMLSLAVRELCFVYGASSSEETFDSPELQERHYNIKPYILKRCCSQPCSIHELLLAC